MLSRCPDGWVHLNGTTEYDPYTPSLTWLFNISQDPNKRNNIADQHLNIAKKLKEGIEHYI